jgi:hypothetical protein
MNIDELAKNFFEIRDQAHLWHLQTTSFAEHKALGGFYDLWLDSADTFIETYSGKYARPVGGFTASVVPYSEGAPLPYIKRVSSFMTSESVRSIAPDTDLQNILDELTAIANRTAYLLTLK